MKVRSLIGSNSATRIAVSVAIAWALAAAGAMAPATASASGVPLAPVSTVAFIANAQALAATPAGFAATSTPSVTVTPSPIFAVLRPVVAKPAKKKKLTVRQKVALVGRAKGLSKAEVNALLWICKRESNFHPTSTSSAGCRGLFQLSPGMTSGHPWKQPTWNTKRAIKYMKGRYHGVLSAKAFWLKHHWY